MAEKSKVGCTGVEEQGETKSMLPTKGLVIFSLPCLV